MSKGIGKHLMEPVFVALGECVTLTICGMGVCVLGRPRANPPQLARPTCLRDHSDNTRRDLGCCATGDPRRRDARTASPRVPARRGMPLPEYLRRVRLLRALRTFIEGGRKIE